MIHLALLLVAVYIIAIVGYALMWVALALLWLVAAPFIKLGLDTLTWLAALAHRLRRH